MTATDQKSVFAVATGLALVLVSNFVGHVWPPFSILATPLLLPGIAVGVHYSLYRAYFYPIVAWNSVLLILNNWLMRKYAGGIHDSEGAMWIFFFSAIAFFLVVLIQLIFAVNTSGSGNVGVKRSAMQTLWVLATGGFGFLLICI